MADPKTALAFASQAVVATHIAPDDLEGSLLTGYDPYPTSLERARQEMALSRYDRDRDGRCDAPECRQVLALTRDNAFGSAVASQVAASLAAIGIDLRIVPGDVYAMHNERKKVPIAIGQALATDYMNASGLLLPVFASSSITPVEGANDSLLGASPSQLREWGYEVTEVPNADDRIDRCMAMVGADQTECWAELDRYLTEDVVPVVPYLASAATYVVSKRVAAYSYCPATSGLALDRIALVKDSE
jgi:hypothetical protein